MRLRSSSGAPGRQRASPSQVPGHLAPGSPVCPFLSTALAPEPSLLGFQISELQDKLALLSDTGPDGRWGRMAGGEI